MFEKIKNNRIKIFKILILIIIILVLIEVVVFQVVAVEEFNKFKHHEHILDEGSIVTFKDLVDKKSGLYELSDSYEIKFEKISLIDGNTIIDALVVNKSGVDLSGISFFIYSKTLTEKGKLQRDRHIPFRKVDFENDDLCIDWNILHADDVDVALGSGKAKRIQIIIKNHSLKQDEILRIQGSSKYVQYKIQNE